MVILIPDSMILGARISADVGVEPRESVTGIVALLENPAKSKATSSRVYSLFLNPVQVIVTCLVSVTVFVFH